MRQNKYFMNFIIQSEINIKAFFKYHKRLELQTHVNNNK